MKEFFKIQLVIIKAAKAALTFAVFVSSTLSLINATPANAQSESEKAVVEIKVGKQYRQLYSLSAIPELISVPVVSSAGEVTSVIEQQLIAVTDKKDLYGILIPTDGGFFGTIVDQSSHTPVYYQLSPKVRISKLEPKARKAALTQEATELTPSDLLLPSKCGDTEHSHNLTRRVSKMVSLPTQNSWRELELFVVSSSEFSADRSEDIITAQVLSTVAAANLFFEPLELKIALSGVQILRADSDPYLDALKRADADEMLNIARAQWSGKPEVKRDVVAVFGTSNYKRYSTSNTVSATDIFGLAYTATACANKDYSVLFASQGSLDSKGELSLAATLAHELGHTLGMSHDGALYNQVPSLMYQTFTLNPSGFSDVSIKQYLTYTRPGLSGGSCLSSIPAPVTVAFEGGASETISIKEGEKFTRTIKVLGAEGTVPKAALLPGATFSATTAQFTFEPGFDLANKKRATKVVTQRFVAKLLDGRQITKELIFKVADVNRAPVIRAVKVSRGVEVRLSFLVSDPDGDSLALSKDSIRTIGRLAGRKNLRFDGKKVKFTWIPQTSPKGVSLNCKITDVQGLSSTAKIRLSS